MDRVRIHSEGFRNLFYLSHLSGGIGLILLLIYISLSIFNSITYNLFLIYGILMIAIPLIAVPPEIIMLLKAKRIIFRHKLKCAVADFENIHKINTCRDIIEIKDFRNNTLIAIRQEHFKNIPLNELSNYIGKLLSANEDINYLKYTSIKFGK